MEKSNKDLMHRVSRLEDENDSLKVCMYDHYRDSIYSLWTPQKKKVFPHFKAPCTKISFLIFVASMNFFLLIFK